MSGIRQVVDLHENMAGVKLKEAKDIIAEEKVESTDKRKRPSRSSGAPRGPSSSLAKRGTERLRLEDLCGVPFYEP